MQVIIIEDEITAIRRLSRLITEYDPQIEIISHLSSVESSVKWFQTHSAPDLIFMDIQLTDGISFQIFEAVTIQTPVIFCTAYDNYAIQAFKVNSIDYLLKPIEKEDLGKSLQKFMMVREQYQKGTTQIPVQELLKLLTPQQEKKETKSRFLSKVGKMLFFIGVEKAAYFFTEHKQVKLVTLDGKSFPIDHTLDELESLLDDNLFFRINRQYIVSTASITHIEYDYGQIVLTLDQPQKMSVTVSKDKSTSFKNWLDK